MVSLQRRILITLIHKSCRKLIVGVLDFRAKTFQLQESKEDLRMEKDQAYSSKSQDLLGNSKKKINPVTYSLKMLKTYLASTKGGTSQSCSLKWMKSGTMRNGTFSTQPKSSLSTGNVFSLSDILEDDVQKNISYHQKKRRSC